MSQNERYNQLAHIVPWIDDHEWNTVRSQLFPTPTYTDPSQSPQVWQALEKIKMWQLRGKVPLSVTSTASFIEIMLRDAHDSAFESELKSLYAFAIIRLVNGLVDPVQKRSYAQSVLGLAKQIQLDPWLVELRHQATHDPVMPSLSCLRLAASVAVQFLYQHYWTNDSSHHLTGDIRSLLIEQLTLYKRARRKILRVQQPASAAAVRDSRPYLEEDPCHSIMHLIITLLDPSSLSLILVPLLLEEGYLVPSDMRAVPVFPGKSSPIYFEIWSPLLSEISMYFPWFMHQLALQVLRKTFQQDQPINDNLFTHPSKSAALFSLFKWLFTTMENAASGRSSSARDAAVRAAVFMKNIPTNNIPDSMVAAMSAFLGNIAEPHVALLGPLVCNVNNNLESPEQVSADIISIRNLLNQILDPLPTNTAGAWRPICVPLIFGVNEVLPLGMTASGYNVDMLQSPML